MEEEEINKLLDSYKNKRSMNKLSAKELVAIMEFLKDKLKNEKGNWVLENRKNIKIYNAYLILGIKKFYTVYKRRIKTNKGLENYIENIEKHERLKWWRTFNKERKKYREERGKYSVSDIQLKLKENTNIRDFLKDFKELKKKYLKGNNAELLELISKINTGYSKSTLRNYFFDCD